MVYVILIQVRLKTVAKPFLEDVIVDQDKSGHKTQPESYRVKRMPLTWLNSYATTSTSVILLCDCHFSPDKKNDQI